MLPAVGARSPNHWTAREFPIADFYIFVLYTGYLFPLKIVFDLETDFSLCNMIAKVAYFS